MSSTIENTLSPLSAPLMLERAISVFISELCPLLTYNTNTVSILTHYTLTKLMLIQQPKVVSRMRMISFSLIHFAYIARTTNTSQRTSFIAVMRLLPICIHNHIILRKMSQNRYQFTHRYLPSTYVPNTHVCKLQSVKVVRHFGVTCMQEVNRTL